MSRLYPVYGNGWQKKVYDMKSLERHSTELDCVNSCLNLERIKCNLFIMDQGKCFLGNIDIINGSISSDNVAIQITTPKTVIVSISMYFLHF